MWFPVTPGPDNLWTWTPDDARHFLTVQDTTVIEVQGSFIHMYDTDGGPLWRTREDGATGDLLADTVRWVDTKSYSELSNLTDANLWEYMATCAGNDQLAPPPLA